MTRKRRPTSSGTPTSSEKTMIEILSRYWWIPVLRGLFGITFGVLAFAYPGAALTVLVIWFGAWAFVDGIFTVVGAIAGRDLNRDWVFDLIGGLLGIMVGILTFRSPGITTLGLLIYIAAWSMLRGIIDIAVAVKLRREIEGEWLLILAGLVSIAFAVLLLWNPGPGALALLWLIAAYAIVFGILAIVFGLKMRSLARAVPLAA
jgi:uncharacterized membrane protein HdeD (DUF308 family)